MLRRLCHLPDANCVYGNRLARSINLFLLRCNVTAHIKRNALFLHNI